MTQLGQHRIHIRVQYNETDGQGRVHHGQYINYFERGRVELLRTQGHSYREFERSGLYLVVAEMNLKYLGAAEFDDRLILTTSVEQVRGVRITHRYQLLKLDEQASSSLPEEIADTSIPAAIESVPGQVIVEGYSVVACVDRTGKVRPLPRDIRNLDPKRQFGS